MFQMYAHGIPLEDAPEWLNVLIVAEEWGVPPWEVLPKYASRRWWLMARNFVAQQKAKAAEYKSKS